MTERRLPVYPPHPPHSNALFANAQWNNTGQHPSHYVSTSHYLPNSYNGPSSHNGVLHNTPYGTTTTQPGEMSYQPAPYNAGESYPSSGNSVGPPRPAYPVSNSTVSPTMSTGHAQRQPHSPTHGRSRSHSQTHHPYLPHQVPAHPPNTHLTPMFPQPIGIPSQYPATPMRPFSCDQCALSFNRQHDLKRHRETHTGEKPFLCNGGCGKTFTRKDALKRHQLVKQCGTSDQDDS